VRPRRLIGRTGAPRDPVDIAGPRRPGHVVVRPLNFTVRRHFVERISKFVLCLEAVVLVYFTAVALIGFYTVVTNGAVFAVATAAAALFCLFGGWRVLVAFLFGDRRAARNVWRGWWYASSIGAVAAVGALLALAASILPGPTEGLLLPLVYGVIFVPTFVHLSAEVWLRAV